MRRRRGFTIVETVSAMIVFTWVIAGAVVLMMEGSKYLQSTSTETALTNTNAQALRGMSEALRKAMSVTITNDGKQISYVWPQENATADPDTGEKEFVYPLTSDGVARSYTVSFDSHTVTDNTTGRVIARDVYGTDPEPDSSQYNQAYAPFSLTTIGGSRAVTINLVTRRVVGPQARYVRLKTTAKLRNY